MFQSWYWVCTTTTIPTRFFRRPARSSLLSSTSRDFALPRSCRWYHIRYISIMVQCEKFSYFIISPGYTVVIPHHPPESRERCWRWWRVRWRCQLHCCLRFRSCWGDLRGWRDIPSLCRTDVRTGAPSPLLRARSDCRIGFWSERGSSRWKTDG